MVVVCGMSTKTWNCFYNLQSHFYSFTVTKKDLQRIGSLSARTLFINIFFEDFGHGLHMNSVHEILTVFTCGRREYNPAALLTFVSCKLRSVIETWLHLAHTILCYYYFLNNFDNIARNSNVNVRNYMIIDIFYNFFIEVFLAAKL